MNGKGVGFDSSSGYYTEVTLFGNLLVYLLFILSIPTFAQSPLNHANLSSSLEGDRIKDCLKKNDSTFIISTWQGKILNYHLSDSTCDPLLDFGEPFHSILVVDEELLLETEDSLLFIGMDGNRNGALYKGNLIFTQLLFFKGQILGFHGNRIFQYDRLLEKRKWMEFKNEISTIDTGKNEILIGFSSGSFEVWSSKLTKKLKDSPVLDEEIFKIVSIERGYCSATFRTLYWWNSDLVLLRSQELDDPSEILSIGQNVIAVHDNSGLWLCSLIKEERVYLKKEEKEEELKKDTTTSLLIYGLKDSLLSKELFSSPIVSIRHLSNEKLVYYATRSGDIVFENQDRTLLNKIELNAKEETRYYPDISNIRYDSLNRRIFIGSARGICGVHPIDLNTTLVQLAYGFRDFHDGYFSSDGKHVFIVDTRKGASSILVFPLQSVNDKKSRRNEKGENVRKYWKGVLQDTGEIMTSELLPNSDIIIISRNNTLIFFDCIQQKLVKEIKTERPVTALAIDKSGLFLMIGDNSGFIRKLNLMSFNWQTAYEQKHEEKINSILVSDDGRFLTSTSNEIKYWDRSDQLIFNIQLENILAVDFVPSWNRIYISIGNIQTLGYFQEDFVEANMTNQMGSPRFFSFFVADSMITLSEYGTRKEFPIQ